MGIGFLGLVARYLGPERFGVLNYVIALFAIIDSVAHLGIGGIITREIVKKYELRHELLSTAVFMRIGSAILYVFFVVFYSLFSNEEERIIHILYIIGLSSVLKAFLILPSFFVAMVQNKVNEVIGLVIFIISLLLKILCVYVWKTSIFTFAWIYVIENFLLLLFQYGYYIKVYGWVWRINLKWVKPFLKEGSWYVFASIAGVLFSQIDTVMLRIWFGTEEVGIYTASTSFNSYYGMLIGLVCATLFPLLVKAYEQDKKKFRQKMLALYSIFGYVTFVYMVGIYLFGETVFLWFYGVTYTESVELLQIRSLCMVPWSWSVMFWHWVTIKKTPQRAFYKIVIGAGVNIIGNWIWIPTGGVLAAVWMTLISWIVMEFIVDLFWKQTREVLIIKIRALVYPVQIIYQKLTR